MSRYAHRCRSAAETPTEPSHTDLVDELVETESFGILTTELRRLEAIGHDIEQLLPRVVQAENLDGVDDLGSLLRYRIQKITSAYPPGPRRANGLIAELVPRATSVTDPAMRIALDEREHLMSELLDGFTRTAIEQPALWPTTLGDLDHEAQKQMVRGVAAYCDRWVIASLRQAPSGRCPPMTRNASTTNAPVASSHA